jgi:hypothetical protein
MKFADRWLRRVLRRGLMHRPLHRHEHKPREVIEREVHAACPKRRILYDFPKHTYLSL